MRKLFLASNLILRTLLQYGNLRGILLKSYSKNAREFILFYHLINSFAITFAPSNLQS